MTLPRRHRNHLRAGGSLLLAMLVYAAALPVSTQAQAQSVPRRPSAFDTADLRGTTDDGTGVDTVAEVDDGSSVFAPVPTPRPTVGSAPDIAGATAASSADPAADVDPLARPDSAEPITGSVDANDRLEAQQLEGEENFGRQNPRISSLDGVPLRQTTEDDGLGIRLGTMILRPTISEKIFHESRRDGAFSSKRIYSETTASGVLQSDWSRHRLTVEGAATIQKNLSGRGQEDPSANLNATLDLDFTRDWTGRLRTGYDYSKEDRNDPNAIAGASAQAAVHRLSGSAGLSKDFGLLRGTTTAELVRTVYGDARLTDGTVISGNDRDNLSGRLSGRVGYELSPLLIPFLEASVERTKFDFSRDTNGYERSATTYALRVGTEFPLGEKLSGELAGGYVWRKIDDARLSGVSGFTVDGRVAWSPLRGTVVNATLGTIVESSTTPGESGSIAYRLGVGLEHELREAVVARLSGSALYRNYPSTSVSNDQTTLGAGAGISWSLNRYVSLEADASYERTTQSGGTDSNTARIGLGLRLRR